MQLPTILSCSDRLTLHNPLIGKPKEILTPHVGPIYSVSWSKNGKFIASGGKDKKIVITNFAKMKPQFELIDDSQGEINSLAFSANNQFLAAGCSTAQISIWNLSNQKIALRLLGLRSNITSVSWNKDSHLLAGGSTLGHITIYDMNSSGSTKINLSQSKYDKVNQIEFSCHKNNIIASASSNGIVRVWDITKIKSNTPFRKFKFHDNICSSLSFSRIRSNFLCSVGHDRKINFYDLRNPKLINSFEMSHQQLTKVSFQDNPHTITIGTMAGKLFSLDLRNTKEMLLKGHGKLPIYDIKIIDSEILKTAVFDGNKRRSDSNNQLRRKTWDFNSEKKQQLNPRELSNQEVNEKHPGGRGSKWEQGRADERKMKSENDRKTASKTRRKQIEKAQQPSNTIKMDEKYVKGEEGEQHIREDLQLNRIDNYLTNFSMEMKEYIHQEIQMVHLDMIRQFEEQRESFKHILTKQNHKVFSLQKEYDQLLLENEQLQKSAY